MSTEPTYDLVVVGGGIAGAGVARDAALRGLSVVLIEKAACGSGTSSKSSKLIHGGIRYLETASDRILAGDLSGAWKNFKFVFASLREAKILERIAPELVKPLPLIIPIYRESKRGRLAVFAGVFLYWLLSFLSGGSKAPQIFWTPGAILKELSALTPEGLRGGVMIHERLVDDWALVKATIESARRNGARIFEETSLIGYGREPGGFFIDAVQNGRVLQFRSRTLVDATGPWVDKTRELGRERGKDYLQRVAGSHIVVKKFLPYSALLEAEDTRLFFVVNIGDRCRVGTTERVHDDPDSVSASEEDVEYLLRSLKRFFSAAGLERKDILEMDAGIRPLARGQTKLLSRISREHKIRVGRTGTLHLLGVKLTDHRRAAEETVNHLLKNRPELAARARACQTARRSLAA